MKKQKIVKDNNNTEQFFYELCPLCSEETEQHIHCPNLDPFVEEVREVCSCGWFGKAKRRASSPY